MRPARQAHVARGHYTYIVADLVTLVPSRRLSREYRPGPPSSLSMLNQCLAFGVLDGCAPVCIVSFLSLEVNGVLYNTIIFS